MRVVLNFYINFKLQPITEIRLYENDVPLYSARVSRLLVRRFLEFLKVPLHETENEIIIEDPSEEVFRRLIIFAGIVQFIQVLGDFQEARLMSFIKELTAIEALFWCSRLLYAYGDYNATRRVAKAFRVLYSF
jgi:hypothetical protein